VPAPERKLQGEPSRFEMEGSSLCWTAVSATPTTETWINTWECKSG